MSTTLNNFISLKRTKKSLLAAIIAANSQGLYAAENVADKSAIEVEEVVVTGVRASIEKSINQKRFSANIVDGINAEDIGQLPDVSIADSIRRIVGVNFQTENGRAETASIRGLGSDLTLTTLNGRVLTTTSLGTRRVALGRLPSELIQQVSISKSPEAKMLEGGVAGTIAMQTIRPLDRKKRSIVGLVRGLYNENASEIDNANELGWRANLSYVDQLLDNQLGIALGWAGFNQEIPNYESRSVNIQARNPNLNTKAGAQNIHFRNDMDDNGVLDVSPAALSYDIVEQAIDRNALMAVLQYDMNSALSFTVDAAYLTQDTNSKNHRLIMAGLLNPQLGPETAENAYIDPNTNNLLAMDLGRAQISSFQNPNLNEDTTKNFGFNSIYETDNWKVVTDLSYSFSSRDRSNITTTTEMQTDCGLYGYVTNNSEGNNLEPGDCDYVPAHNVFNDNNGNITYTDTGDRFLVSNGANSGQSTPVYVNVGGVATAFRRQAAFDLRDRNNIVLGFDPAVENPEQWALRSLLDLRSRSEDEITALKVDANWNIDQGILASLDMGARIERHEAQARSNRDKYKYPNNDDIRPALDNSYLAVEDFPYAKYYDTFGNKSLDGTQVTNKDGREIALDYTPYWPIWNENSLLNIAKADAKNLSLQRSDALFFDDEINTFDLANTYAIEEKTLSAYIQANFSTDLFDKHFSGNAGLRVVKTDILSTGEGYTIDDVRAIVVDQDAATDDATTKFDISYVNGNLKPFTAKNSYTEFLPSFNSTLELRDDLYFRFAAARTLSRPTFISMRNTRNWTNPTRNAKNLDVESGNPYLNPFIADQADIALEWYANKDLNLSMSLYHKNVKAYTEKTTSSSTVSVKEAGNEQNSVSIELLEESTTNIDQEYYFQGLELSYQQTFSQLPFPFNGFGVQANASFNRTDARDTALAAGESGELVDILVRANNVSKNIYNFIAFYEQSFGSVRLAWQRQSPYNRSTLRAQQESNDGLLDLTLNIKAMDNLRVLGSITNLTDENISRYAYDVRNSTSTLQFPQAHVSTGRTYSLGVRVTF